MSSLTPDDLGVSYSTSASGSGEGKGAAGTRFRWCSSWNFMMGAVCYTVSYSSYNSYGTEGRPGAMQYLLLMISIGLPSFYTQTFLGQYCQMGMLNFRHIMPMARGLMYTFLISVIIKTIRFGYILRDVMLYFLMSFQNVLPWAVCPKGYEDVCNEVTMNDSYPHTAYVFWRFVYAGDPVLDIDNISYEIPTLISTISFGLQWIIMFIIVVAAYDNHRKVSRILFYLHFLILCVLLITTFIFAGKNITIVKLLLSQTDELLNMNSWLLAVRSVTVDLCLADLYNMYAGAHLPTMAPSGTLSTGCVFAIVFSNFLGSCLSATCFFIIESKYTTVLSLKEPYELGFGVGNILIVIPQGISYLTLPQWWNAIFFTSCMCTLITNQILHLVSVQMTITDMYPNFGKYKIYLMAGCCLFGFFVGGLLESKSLYAATKYATENATDNLLVICVFIWSVAVYWVYGVGRLSDDIQFTMGVQPTMFWKIAWYISPSIYAFMIVAYAMLYVYMDIVYILINICVLVILLTPYVLFFVLELFVNIRKKNLLGTFQAHKKWGPPDLEERLYRKFFNPRTETKYQAHKMICRHNCLLTSVGLKNIVQKEDALRAEFFGKALKASSSKSNDVPADTSSVVTNVAST